MEPLTRSYVHRGGSEPLLGDTIDQRFVEIVSRYPGHEAVVSLHQNRRLTYRQLDDGVERLARALVASGVEVGDRVGIWSTDNAEWIVIQLATARVGAVLVNINPANRVAELEHALRLARVNFLFTIPRFRSSNYVEMIAELCPEIARQDRGRLRCERLPELRSVVLFDPDGGEHSDRPLPGIGNWPELIAAGRAVSDDQMRRRSHSLDRDDPINIQFTSGTTGFPKAVALTHHNILNNAHFVAGAMRFEAGDRLCVPVPFYHCFGMVLANLVCLDRGATIVIPAPHFDPLATLEAIEAERCTAVHGVPTMFIAQLEQQRQRRRDLSSLRTGIMAGAPCPPDLLVRVIEELGCREILIAYGQTEASPVTHLTVADDSFEHRVQTVGTNLPHQEAKVVHTETGATLPVGEQGEICFRGYHVMRCYFDNADGTRRAIDEAGWLHSGDLGVMGSDGYLRITGRVVDMIIRGGENVYPAEIEAFYFRHPKVADVAVFGVPDDRLGEEIGAWIKLHAGETASAAELRDYAAGKISHFKVPHYIWIVDEFPMTVTGKVQKYRIRDIALRELASSGGGKQ